jgi:hypothetical protein
VICCQRGVLWAIGLEMPPRRQRAVRRQHLNPAARPFRVYLAEIGSASRLRNVVKQQLIRPCHARLSSIPTWYRHDAQKWAVTSPTAGHSARMSAIRDEPAPGADENEARSQRGECQGTDFGAG